MVQFVRKNLLTISGQFFPPGIGNPSGTPPNDNPFPTTPSTPIAPVTVQPSSVTCVLTYYAPVSAPTIGSFPSYGAPSVVPPVPSPSPLKATISLVLQSDGVTWTGTWDSSVAEGRVDWVIYSAGAVVAAAQGNFVVSANSANVTVT